MPLADDLYKALLDESKLYREKVSTIWLQKFTMLGAIIVFAAVRSEAVSQNPRLIAAALLSLPVIAVLLDIKLGEFGIHANVIDHFVMRNYPEPPILGDWERTKWGLGPTTEDRALIRLRSIATVAVTVIPTCIIAALSVLAVRPFIARSAYAYLEAAAAGFCLLYLTAGWISMRAVLFRQEPTRMPSEAEQSGPDRNRPQAGGPQREP
jgi:hypothetical protein